MKEVIVDAEDLVCLNKEKLQEIIRCKDCFYYQDDYRGRKVCYDTGIVRNSIDFCSQAKRKEDERFGNDYNERKAENHDDQH